MKNVKDFKNVDVKVENSVAYIAISNPPANLISSETVHGLSNCIDFLADNETVKVIVITGEGKFFAAGADIKEFKNAFDSREKGKDLSVNAQAVLSKIDQLNKPVIAAINGACLGGGLELAMSCHMRIAADDAKLGQPELNLGLIPGFGGTQRLARLTNGSKALEIILTGQFISGEKAEHIGLVNKSVPRESLMAEVKQFAESIALNKSQLSVAAAIEAVTNGLQTTLDEGLALEADLWADLFTTEDMKEGVNAFIEKREANFTDK
ncbi:enoyl-CoA hydratase-related protein [Halobacillus litoralis]|uniref:enoyl-CoA hydratase-related protein n=1 Tax=Halobacillus litoralis TaxID=45668 RepID=UPI001CD6324A|nr:enoyl-CoA hydratase-related protein [Halobacillus litoralis]MCA1024290.1 enoyl-CoA hydratase/isomerase family protein [Halobacillus litoralis]